MKSKMSENQNLTLVVDQPKKREYFTEYYRSVHKYLVSLTLSPVEADDLAQETYLRAINYIDKHGPPQHPLNWLLTVARSACIDKARRAFNYESGNSKDMKHSLLDPGQEPLENICLLEKITDMQAALNRLGSLDSSLIEGFYKNDCTYAELAQQYNLSKEAVKSRLRRARNRVKLREDQYSPA